MPVCAPELRATCGFEAPADIRKAPLLHLTTRPDAWEAWLRAHGADDHAVQGMLFDQFSHVSEAAALGLGLALLPSFLFEAERDRGRLIAAAEGYEELDAGYYLVWPKSRVPNRALGLFIDWLARNRG